MPVKRMSPVLGALAVVLLGVSACGDDGGQAGDETTTTAEGPDGSGDTAETDDDDGDDGAASTGAEPSEEYCARAEEVDVLLTAIDVSVDGLEAEVLRDAIDPLLRLGDLAPAGKEDYVLLADGFRIFAEYSEALDPADPEATPEPEFDEEAYDAAAERVEATVEACGISFED